MCGFVSVGRLGTTCDSFERNMALDFELIFDVLINHYGLNIM